MDTAGGYRLLYDGFQVTQTGTGIILLLISSRKIAEILNVVPLNLLQTALFDFGMLRKHVQDMRHGNTGGFLNQQGADHHVRVVSEVHRHMHLPVVAAAALEQTRQWSVESLHCCCCVPPSVCVAPSQIRNDTAQVVALLPFRQLAAVGRR